jgi:hypothetical protein
MGQQASARSWAGLPVVVLSGRLGRPREAVGGGLGVKPVE